jgi:hypothetical protein
LAVVIIAIDGGVVNASGQPQDVVLLVDIEKEVTITAITA